MRQKRRKRWTLALGLTSLGILATSTLPVPGAGSLAALVGAGPVTLSSMLICGTCAGVGAGMVLSGTWVAALSSMGAWKWIGVCGAACLAALRI